MVCGGGPHFLKRPNEFQVCSFSNFIEGILSLFSVRKRLTFKELLPSESKQDKVYTFIPLLHLSNQQKVDLEQAEPFGDIHVKLPEGKNVQQ